MTNRHDRRKAAKIGTVTTISLPEFQSLPAICAWHGCNRTAKNPQAAGWHNLILYKGALKLSFVEIEHRNMERDCVLCPEHAAYLDENLLVDIGGRLQETMGTA